MFGAMSSFYLLLSVVPYYATAVGGTGVDAGLSTGTLLLFTVLAELATPALVARLGRRKIFGVGLALMGGACLLLPVFASGAGILASCAVRGLGFGLVVVVGGASVTLLLPAERRGEGLGLYGVVVGVPAIVALPAGVWLVARLGYPSVFVAAAVLALLGLLAVPSLRSRGADVPLESCAALARGPGRAELGWPAAVFALSACGVGIAVTFLPLAVEDPSGALVPGALLGHSVLSAASRWWSGRRGDRSGGAPRLVPGTLLSIAGLALMALMSPAALVFGMALLGAGFGIAQSASLARMFTPGPGASVDHDLVSTVWNLAYDAGMGLGAALFGWLAVRAGYPAGFAIAAAALALLTLAPAAGRARYL